MNSQKPRNQLNVEKNPITSFVDFSPLFQYTDLIFERFGAHFCIFFQSIFYDLFGKYVKKYFLSSSCEYTIFFLRCLC